MTKNCGGFRGGVSRMLALLLIVAAGVVRAATPVAGIVISVEGKPEFKQKGAKAFKLLKRNDTLNEGDTVKTGPGAKVAVAFVGGAELRINENSSFRMESGGGAKPTSVFTEAGNAWTRLLHGKSGMQVRTPSAVAAVRGTEADVDQQGAGPMTVKVYEGFVDLINKKGTTALREGQMASVAGAGSAPGAAKAMSNSDRGTWQKAVEADSTDLNKSLKLLEAAADKSRTLELDMKDKDGKPKKVKMHFEKK